MQKGYGIWNEELNCLTGENMHTWNF